MKKGIPWFSLLGLDKLQERARHSMRDAAVGLGDRATLARLEWLDQKERIQRLALIAAVVIAFTVVLLFAFSAAILVQFWDTPYRQMVGWLIAVFWLLAWTAALVTAVKVASQIGNGFSLTRQELRRDWQSLKERL
jgi:uncharacterized membrane protein YqjE